MTLSTSPRNLPAADSFLTAPATDQPSVTNFWQSAWPIKPLAPVTRTFESFTSLINSEFFETHEKDHIVKKHRIKFMTRQFLERIRIANPENTTASPFSANRLSQFKSK
jgi:hypothetical protein